MRVPATRYAEELGNRLFTNLVALGFFTAVTGVVTADAMKKALPGLVPDRFLKINIKAFDKGYEHGISDEPEDRRSRVMTKKRTGVFVCHCGTNIAATVDVAKVAKEMAGEEHRRLHPGIRLHVLGAGPGVGGPGDQGQQAGQRRRHLLFAEPA